jgi:hypothetical protein
MVSLNSWHQLSCQCAVAESYIALLVPHQKLARALVDPPEGANCMSISRTLILGPALMFTTGIATLAAQSSTQNTLPRASDTTRAVVHEEVGTIHSITSTELVLWNNVKGTQAETTFTLNSETKTDGEIGTGAHVAVYYKNQNHERVATEIRARGETS